MKKLTIILLLTIANSAFSQVIIGDKIGTATDKTSVLLEFANTGNKGIILPYVRTKNDNTSATPPTEGTIILDATNPTTARIKFYNGVVNSSSTDGWQDLSGQNADITSALVNQPTESVVAEGTNSKAIIGASTTSADGVLVLESNTKAMVLPIVASSDDIPSPSPGMMVFINKSGAKRFAVYNGSKWSYWKP